MGTVHVQGMHRVRRGVVWAVGVMLLVGLVTTGASHAFASTPNATQGGVAVSQIQGDPFCFFGTSDCYAASLTVNTTTGTISGSCDNLSSADQCSIAGTLTGTNAVFTITWAGAYAGETDAVNGTLSGTTITGSYVDSFSGVVLGGGSNFIFTSITVTSGTPCIGTSCGSDGAATPELGSGELLATGLLPIGAVLLYRRRRTRLATRQQ